MVSILEAWLLLERQGECHRGGGGGPHLHSTNSEKSLFPIIFVFLTWAPLQHSAILPASTRKSPLPPHPPSSPFFCHLRLSDCDWLNFLFPAGKILPEDVAGAEESGDDDSGSDDSDDEDEKKKKKKEKKVT